MMTLKSEREIELMAESGRILGRIFTALKDFIKPGIKTEEIDALAREIITQAGAEPSFYHYGGPPPFPGVVCVSIDEEVVHGIPGKRRLKEGEIITVDVGAKLNGFHSDAARTYAVGEISDEAKRIMAAAEKCFWLGVEQAVVGNRLGDISAAIEGHARAQGYGVIRELTGHGIGRELHEPPEVRNYGIKGRGVRIVAGMTIAIEPMITQGARYVRQLADGWTIVTEDGSLAAHYENTLAITKKGPRVLTLEV